MNKILFTHIPKTAGTSFRHILDFNYNKDEILRCRGRKAFILARNKKVFMGHLPYGIHKYRPFEKFDYITFFRNPIDRTISHYYFVLQGVDHANHQFHQNHSIEEILNYNQKISNFGSLRDNLQTRFLYGVDALSYKNISDLKLLNKAKEHLGNKYKTFGIQEKFEESVVRMCEELNLNYNQELIEARNKVTKTKEELPQSTIDLITEKNKLDIELYEFAIKLKYS